jgi:hypothetical protein
MRHLLGERIKIGADEQQLSAGIGDDVSHFGRRQPEVDRH